MKKYCLIIGLSILTSTAFSSTQQIKVKFLDRENIASNMISIQDLSFECNGKDQAYYYESHKYQDSGKEVELIFNGPFSGDKRKSCLPIDGIDPYFVLKNFTVEFFYKNVRQQCIINQRIGLTYNSGFYIKYDKLQGSENNRLLPCGNNNEFEYRLVTGHNGLSYDKGYIEIYNPHSFSRTFYTDQSIYIKFNESNFTNAEIIKTPSLACPGLYNQYKYVKSGTLKDGLYFLINGPYEDDNRSTCKAYGFDTYFIIDDLKVGFDYDGKKHYCYIGSDSNGFGTTWDTAWQRYDKLKGINDNKAFLCDPSDDIKFTYTVHPGYREKGYSQGYISIDHK